MNTQWNTLTLGDIVNQNTQAAQVFEAHGLDYCCGGRELLQSVCERRGLDVNSIIEKLDALPNDASPDVSQWSTEFLIDYIVNTHHQYVRTMLPVISEHAVKVASRHGDSHPETVEVRDSFHQIRAELEAHMMKEEQILFPYIKRLVAVSQENASEDIQGLGSVRGPISVMEVEHENVGRVFGRIHDITNDLTLPDDACTTYTLLYKELDEFERDLHMHIHLENNVLHPRATQMEDALVDAA